jgi:hypothetical protein
MTREEMLERIRSRQWYHLPLSGNPLYRFYPANKLNEDYGNWFSPKRCAIESGLRTAGFNPMRSRTAHCPKDRCPPSRVNSRLAWCEEEHGVARHREVLGVVRLHTTAARSRSSVHLAVGGRSGTPRQPAGQTPWSCTFPRRRHRGEPGRAGWDRLRRWPAAPVPGRDRSANASQSGAESSRMAL